MFAHSDVIVTTMIRCEAPVVLFFILFVVIFIAAAIYSHIKEKKRREALQSIASSLGLSFSQARDRSMASSYGFLNRLRAGENRYAYNIMRGNAPEGYPVVLFDYHYETTHTDSDGDRRTTHYYFSVFTLTMKKQFPELIIEPEGFFSKIAQAFGFDDIDFESHEFSRRYKVKSPDKKFAYDVCNAQMIDYLLKQEKLAIELESNVLAMVFSGQMKPENVKLNYERLQKIRSLMPNYLFS